MLQHSKGKIRENSKSGVKKEKKRNAWTRNGNPVAGCPTGFAVVANWNMQFVARDFVWVPARSARSAGDRASAASASTTVALAPLRFSISTYYRLTALCQRSGVKLLKKIAEAEKNVSRNWLVACSVACLDAFLPALRLACPIAARNRIPNECFSTLP